MLDKIIWILITNELQVYTAGEGGEPLDLALGNLRFKTTVNGYGWTSTRGLG